MSQQDDLSVRYAHLSPTKRALLQAWQRGKYLKIDSGEAIPRLPRPYNSAPLSFAQQHIWNFERSHPGTAVYNFPFGSYSLHGPLNVKALEQSLNEVVRRHEILRTTFVESEGQALQIIAPSLTIPLTIIDLQNYPAHLHASMVPKIVHEEMLHTFDLAHGPLLRVTLIQISAVEHILTINAHHLVYDGWSQGVFFRELTTLYPAFVNGTPPEPAELPIQYADFAVWQRQWMQGSVMQAQLDYWKQQLKDAPPALNLPTDYERSTAQRHRSKNHSIQLPQQLVERLRAFCQQEELKLFMVVFAAFSILHYRHSKQEDILIGTPISNRNRPEIEKLIGCFVNTLVIRTHVSDTMSCREYLGQVRKVILEAYGHQVLPFEKLIEELQPPASPNGIPLIKTMLIMHDVPLPQIEFADITVRTLDIFLETTLYDLILAVIDINAVEGLKAVLRYNCDLYSEATVVSLLAQWQSILESIITNPDLSILNRS